MKRMRFSLLGLLSVMCMVLFGVVPPQSASAASVYDGVISVSSMTMNQGSCSGDIGSSYAGLLSDPSNWLDSTNQASAYADFQDVLNEGSGWAVVKQEYKGSFSNVTPDGTHLVAGTSIIRLIYTAVINPQAPWQPVGVSFKYSNTYSYSLMGTDVPFWVVQFVWDNQQSPCTLKVWNAGMQNGLDIPFANEDTDATMWSGLLHLRPVFINMPITYPSGYEGEMIPSGYSLPSPTYIAMGDSFSSGEGNDPFESGTDESGVNECHRSPDAYPEWLSQTPSLDMGNYLSVACSGATTNDVLGVTEADNPTGIWNEPAQVDALSDETQVVTITIGGNDIGFSDFATACVVGDCDSSTNIYTNTMASIDGDLPSKIDGVLEAISERTDHADVYVIGYPYITPDTSLDSLPVQCSYLDSSSGSGQDSVAARAVVTELNGVLGDAVNDFVNTASSTAFTFIDPNNSVDGTFDGHDVCQGEDSYFYNVTPNDVLGNGYRAKLFHPNVYGQHEYYNIVMGEIEAN